MDSPQKLNNRGAAIITVLIGILCVMALGSALLFTAYTSYRMKMTERAGKQTFYSADAAMSELRSGLQTVVTESIATAYTQVLVDYNNSAVETDKVFRDAFIKALTSWQDDSGSPLFTQTRDGYHYDPAVLARFLSVADRSLLTITCPNDQNVRLSPGKDAIETLTLLGISLDYRAKGFESHVSSDLTIAMPSFAYALSEYSISGIPEFAVIADQGLTQSSGGGVDLEISGSAYAGKVDLTHSSNNLTIKGGSLICGSGETARAADDRSGVVSVSGTTDVRSARLTVAENASLWAKRVVVQGGSSVALLGDAYIANDLELAGYQGRAKLAGRYYGFGFQEEAQMNAPGAGDASSAILVNGLGSQLDLSGLNSLMLAGNSYISKGTAGTGADVLMGQSISVKSDQLAYLVPAGSLSLQANPALVSGSARPTFAVDTTAVLWTIGGKPKALKDYTEKFKSIYVPLGGDSDKTLLYVFMEFETKEKANAYFQDYFSQNSQRVQDYLQAYVTLSDTLRTDQSLQSSGNTYRATTKDAIRQLSLLQGTDATSLRIASTRLRSMYNNLCVTLSSNISSATATSPFDYVINAAAVNTLNNPTTNVTKFYDAAHNVVALIVRGNYVISAATTPETVRLIIATGNVTVNQPYTGLLIAQGTVDMKYSIMANSTEVVAALEATEPENNRRLIEFLNLGANVGGGGGAAGGASSWDADALVSYTNWQKN